MSKATKTVAMWFGISTGLAALEHGYFEILQGNTRRADCHVWGGYVYATNRAFAVWDLSNRYAAATTDAQRAAVEGGGKTQVAAGAAVALAAGEAFAQAGAMARASGNIHQTVPALGAVAALQVVRCKQVATWAARPRPCSKQNNSPGSTT